MKLKYATAREVENTIKLLKSKTILVVTVLLWKF